MGISEVELARAAGRLGRWEFNYSGRRAHKGVAGDCRRWKCFLGGLAIWRAMGLLSCGCWGQGSMGGVAGGEWMVAFGGLICSRRHWDSAREPRRD